MLWYLPKGHRPEPTTFRLRGYPVNELSRTWNLIEGKHCGIQILILDSTLGRGPRGWVYTTFIAARTETNPFTLKSGKEKMAHSNGWTALYRLRYWQVPWTLSIQRIEEHLNSFVGLETAK